MGKLVDLVKSGINLFEAQQHLPSAEDAEVDAEDE